MTQIDPHTVCMGKSCEWSASASELGCSHGAGDCYSAVFSKSNKLAFQDDALQEATDKINEILAKIPSNADKNVKLSIITTGNELMLAWVNHNRAPQKGDINSKSNSSDITAALGII